MADVFLSRLAAEMSAAGFDAKFDGLYLVVAGCRFDAESKRSRKTEGAYSVKFLGSSFKVLEDESFDVARAVGLLVSRLPERLKEKQTADAGRKFRTKLMERVCGTSPVTDDRWKDWYPVDGGWLSSGPDGIELKTVHPSVEEALACLEKLIQR